MDLARISGTAKASGRRWPKYRDRICEPHARASVDGDATIGIVGEGDGYSGFQHFGCDVGHFGGCATRDDDSYLCPDRRTDNPFIQGGVHEPCHGDNATWPCLLSKSCGLAQLAGVNAVEPVLLFRFGILERRGREDHDAHRIARRVVARGIDAGRRGGVQRGDLRRGDWRHCQGEAARCRRDHKRSAKGFARRLH